MYNKGPPHSQKKKREKAKYVIREVGFLTNFLVNEWTNAYSAVLASMPVRINTNPKCALEVNSVC